MCLSFALVNQIAGAVNGTHPIRLARVGIEFEATLKSSATVYAILILIECFFLLGFRPS